MSFVRVRVESTGKENAFGQEIGVETPLSCSLGSFLSL